MRGKDGEYRRILGRGKILSRDASGRPLRVIGTHTDLTARKATERALQESEALFRNAFQVSPLGFGMTTLDGRWVEANEALCRITGYSRQELLGLHWQEMSLPDELPDLHAILTYIVDETAHIAATMGRELLGYVDETTDTSTAQ